MDKSWIHQLRNSEAYVQGVCDFMEFAKQGAIDGKVRCPCKACKVDRKKILSLEEVERHILFKGFYKEYQEWIFHGPLTLAQNVAKQMGRTFEIPNQSKLIGQDDIGGSLRDATGFNMPYMDESIGDHNKQFGAEQLGGDNEMDDQIPGEQPNTFTLEEDAKYMKILDAANELQASMDAAITKFKECVANYEKPPMVIQNEISSELMYSNDDDSNQRVVGYDVGITRSQVFGLKGQRKRPYCDELDNSSIELLNIKAHLDSLEKRNDERISQLQQRNEALEQRIEILEKRSKALEKVNKDLRKKNELFEKRNEEVKTRNDQIFAQLNYMTLLLEKLHNN